MNESNKPISSPKTPVSQKPKGGVEDLIANLIKISDTLSQITDNRKLIVNALNVIHDSGIDFSKVDKKTKALIKEQMLQSGHFNDKELKLLNLFIDTDLKAPAGQKLAAAAKDNKLEKLDQTSSCGSKIPGSIIWAAIATLLTLHEHNDKKLVDIQKQLKALQGNIHLYNELARVLNEALAMNDGKGPQTDAEWRTVNAKFVKNVLHGPGVSKEDRVAFAIYARSQGFNTKDPKHTVHDKDAEYLWSAVGKAGLTGRLNGMQNQAKKLSDEASEVSTRAQDVITKNNDIISIASGLSGGMKDQSGQFWSRM